MARPKKQIDLEQLLKLAEKQWTYVELASFFRVDRHTIERRYGPEILQARASGCAKLRDAQLHKALVQSDTKMLIWLGKQYLGQKDQKEISLASIPKEEFLNEAERRLREGT